MMDLDHFSSVNERFGHAGGDHALVAFASLLRKAVRPADLVSRYGGEEFSAFLIGTGLREAAGVAERIRASLVDHTAEVQGQQLRITVSIGVALLQDGDLLAAIRAADEALYRAKADGRNRIATAPAGGPLRDAMPRRLVN
jgi:diguanylate cyclase (GGDEF)-like protein